MTQMEVGIVFFIVGLSIIAVFAVREAIRHHRELVKLDKATRQ